MKGTWKKVGILLVSALFLCGCAGTEPEERSFPMAMGLGFQEGQYQLYLAMPRLSLFAGETGEPEETVLLWSYEGAGMEQIMERIDTSQEQQVDFGHMQAVILERSLLENEKALNVAIQYWQGQPNLGGNAYVFQTDALQQVMEENGTSMNSLGEYLMGLSKKKEEKPSTLQQVYNEWYNQNEAPDLYRLAVNDGKITMEEAV